MRRLAAPSLTVLALAFGLWAGTPDAATGQGRASTDNLPVLLTSDEMTSDEELGVVTASGNVEIAHGGRILRADTLTYNRRTGVVTASGNVSVVEATGEVAFAEYVELTSDLRDGVMRSIRTMLADQSRFAAVTARRADGSRTVMRRATYSPCEACEKDPTRAPIWQLRASRITHDAEQKEIVYDDAWLEIAGVPVFYTPYLSHPDGTEKRKSGFLVPEISTSSSLGPMLVTPYFWTLGPSADITLMPGFILENNSSGSSNGMFSSDSRSRFLPMGEYRQRLSNGEYKVHGSWLTPINALEREGVKDNRGHIAVDGKFDIDDNWRWGLNALRASDKSYLNRYRMYQRFQILQQESLESRLYTEGFQDRGYASLESFAYQSIRPEDDPATSPVVLPVGRYSYVGQPQSHGAYWSFDTSAYSIQRREGLNSQRATAIGGWHLPYTTSDGSAYKFSATLQSDLFHANALDFRTQSSAFGPESAGFNTRVLPQVGLEWRRPFIRFDGDYRTILEPIAAVYAAPNLGSQRQYPNQESRTVTFDDTNLFSMNRFPGADRLESGGRFVYGGSMSFRHVQGSYVSAMLGQQLRTARERALPADSGFDTTTSDIVGRLVLAPHPWLTTSYRFQADDRTGSLLRQVTGVTLGPQALQFSASYIQVDRALQPTALRSINQISYNLSTQMNQNWRLRALAAQSLVSSDPGLLYGGLALAYEDECFLFGIDFLRRNIGRSDVPSDSTLFFRFGLRNLGFFNLRGV